MEHLTLQELAHAAVRVIDLGTASRVELVVLFGCPRVTARVATLPPPNGPRTPRSENATRERGSDSAEGECGRSHEGNGWVHAALATDEPVSLAASARRTFHRAS